jgi:putative endonuclease
MKSGATDMTKKRIQVGQAGEKAARDHLEKIGYKIVQTNYRCPLGEIDIVARDNATLVIIEVRTKTGSAYGLPEESITAEKARRLRRLTLYYLQKIYGCEVACRIDLVAVMLNRDDLSVRNLNHIRAIL